MQTKARNKMVTGKERDERKIEKFFYPDHQVTVEAESREEADELVKKQEVEE